MLPADQDRVVIVLVRARNPANIGAVARAMHDLGFTRLRVVNEYAVPFQAALAASRAAVHASSVLESASQPLTLAAAVADCTLVLGTSAVGDRALEHPLHLLPAAAPLVHTALAASPEARVALLFGSEKTGLSNDELSLCHALVTIPMNPRTPTHLSMNLGQAVAVCLYEFIRLQPQPAPIVPPDAQAPAADLDRLGTLLAEVLHRSGYTCRHPANSRPAALRRLVRRMALSPGDAPVWTGILRQLLHTLPAAPLNEDENVD